MSIIVYGIKTCSTVTSFAKKLRDQGFNVTFYDYLSEGVDEKTLLAQVADLGWEVVINKRARNFTALPTEDQEYLNALTGTAPDARAIALVKANPKMVKRPIIWDGHKYFVEPKLELAVAALKQAK